MKRHLLFPLLLLALLLPVPAQALLDYGEAAPDFEAKSLAGDVVHLSDFKGRGVLLKLATTWCPTCKQQMQEIAAVKDFLDDNNVVVLEVFLQDTEEMIKAYLDGKSHPKNYIPVLDDGQARNAYNVYLIPRVLIIDGDMKVRRDGSLMSASDLKQMIKPALPAAGS